MSFGCVGLPPNNLRLITTEPAGRYPTLLHFGNGTFFEDGEKGVALMAGRSAVAMFDYKGSANRFDLLLMDGADRALYERIGQYGPLAGRPVENPPIGVRCRAEGGRIRGTVDVFVARSERRDIGTRFEHFPLAMRVVGYFVIPAVQADPKEHPLAPLVEVGRDGRRSVYPNLHTLAPVTGRGRLEPIVADLPPLPLIDVEYLVPTSLQDVFRPGPL